MQRQDDREGAQRAAVEPVYAQCTACGGTYLQKDRAHRLCVDCYRWVERDRVNQQRRAALMRGAQDG